MPPKRPASTSTETPKKAKKAKSSTTGQGSLDAFFKSPTKTLPSPDKGKGKAREIEVIDVDLEDDDVVPSSTIEAVATDVQKTSPPSGTPELQLERSRRNGSVPISSGSIKGASASSTNVTAKLPFGVAVAGPSNANATYPDLTTDPLLFDVSKCPWTAGKPAPYSFLAHTFASLSSTRSRILLTNTLVNTLRFIIEYDHRSLLATLYLLSNSISPPYVPVEMNIGPSIISKALQSVSGLSNAALRKMYNSLGDPGDVAFEAKSSVRTLIPHPPLGIQGVYDSLIRISNSKGNGAAKQKQSIIEKLLVAAKGEESRYLVRTLSQNIRVGAVRTTMISALARAFVLTRPPSCPAPPDDSDMYAPPNLLEAVRPLPEQKKKSGEEDSARERVKDMFLKAEALLKKVYVQHPNYGHIVEAALQNGFENIQTHVPLAVGVPLLPTLGSPTRSLDEIYERIGDIPFTAEFKYDGQRAQIHAFRTELEGSKHLVKLFSRHLEDMTEKYPDIISLVNCVFKESPNISSFIMDAEVVAVDPTTGDVKSFQELSNRPKKDVNLREVKVVVCVYAFDLMYLNGQILLEEPFRARRDLLRTNFPPFTPDDKFTARLNHVESCESGEGREDVEEFFQSAVISKSEGLMIKILDSGEAPAETEDVDESTMQSPKKGKKKSNRKPLPATYEPDKRTSSWLKLKKDYVQGLGDSFDLVPVGAWHGNGRKAKWWSPILLAIWDPRRDSLVAVCKCMSGFTDAFYQAMSDKYKEGSDLCSKQPFKGIECDFGDLRPSVFFKPSEVWELQGADITISPRSKAALGLVSDQRGLSIRFPRFIRIREDKGIEDASGPDFLVDLYRNQEGRDGQRKETGGVDDGDLIDADIESEDEMLEDD